MNAFEIKIMFPSDGDSAVVELTYDDIGWAYVELRDIDLAAEGEARVVQARVVVDLWPMVGTEPHASLWRRLFSRRDVQAPSHDPAPERFECGFEDVAARLEQTRTWWSFRPADAIPHLERARDVLLENERGRVLLEDEQGLTLAGAAWSKMSPENQAAMDSDSDENLTQR